MSLFERFVSEQDRFRWDHSNEDHLHVFHRVVLRIPHGIIFHPPENPFHPIFDCVPHPDSHQHVRRRIPFHHDVHFKSPWCP